MTGAAAALVGDIYDAALDPSGLGRLPPLFARLADGGSAVVGAIHPDGRMEAATVGLPDDALTRYAAHYHSVNPFYDAAMARGPRLQARCGADEVPDAEFRRTEFYWDFARELDTFQILGGVFPLGNGAVAELGVHRGERNARYESRDVGRIQRAMPHLQRALQLRLRLGLGERVELGYAALDALAIGCVICERGGRILFANAAAEALALEGGLLLGRGRAGVTALRPADARRLAALIEDVGSGGSGGAVAATGPAGGRLFVLVAPLPPRFGATPGHALVTMRSADAEPPITAAALRRLFDLTEAEARLARALVCGRSLAAFGAERGVSENTLRTQVASVLRKTGASNQRDLVRLLGLLPPVRG